MRTVYKYPLSVEKLTVTGGDPRVVHVGVDPAGDDDLPCAWVELDPDGNDTLALTYVGTGQEVPFGWSSHVGSVVTAPGLVWHVYQEDEF